MLFKPSILITEVFLIYQKSSTKNDENQYKVLGNFIMSSETSRVWATFYTPLITKVNLQIDDIIQNMKCEKVFLIFEFIK